MTDWRDRLKSPKYTSPSGEVFVFEYEDLERSRSKKVGKFDFPALNGTYLQDLGNVGGTYPIKVIFSGAEHDTEADRFFNATGEIGAATLDHPRYGTLRVLPLSVKQVDAVKTKANQTTLLVTYQETLENTYPIKSDDAVSDIDENTEQLKDAGGSAYGDVQDLPDGVAETIEKQETLSMLDSIEDNLNGLLDDSAEFAAAIDEVRENIDEFIEKPITLLNTLSEVVLMPARAIGNTINAVTGGYIELVRVFNNATDIDRIKNLTVGSLDDHLSSNDSSSSSSGGTSGSSDVESTSSSSSVLVSDPSTASANINSAQRNQTMSLIAVSGLCRSATVLAGRGAFSTRSDAIAMSESIIELWEETRQQFDSIQTEFVGVGQLEYQWSADPEQFSITNEIVKSAVNGIVSVSFGLYTERSVILAEDSDIITLSFRLYGDVSNATVQKLIDTNSLKGEEILMLPEGKEIFYYA
ncbi:DNA circularization N-terminal domain-containing protein [Vibrio parahaemolyticus]|nr:DNA circularization N-terminal domain-containing protein [Vibrio parahaemolyticus]HAV1412728.1 hypothetical protein [Vibrio parahaemolyticus]HAV2004810.1 hypothetical protein [Vibrio parahaemolyticus]